MNVLIVEDSPTLQWQLSRHISKMGHSLITASCGEEAVQIMENNPADLVICDVEMPGLDGYETVSIIREALDEQWVPIIFITSRDSQEDFNKGFDAGADEYLTKPVDVQILKHKIDVMERLSHKQIEINQLKEYINENAKLDELTQVYTPSYFLEMAMLHWSILSRQRLSVSMLVIDIDYFLPYADYYGEKAAEECLKKIANTISSVVKRPGDFVGRLQKNDFILMLPDTGREGAEKVARKICIAVEELEVENKSSRSSGVVSVSIGGATCIVLKQHSLSKAIEMAQDSLRAVKHNNGNNAEIRKFESMKCFNVDSSD